MNIINNTKKYTVEAFKKILDFDGKANRPQFWYFVLGYTVAYFALLICAVIFGMISDGLASIFSLLCLLLYVAAIIPSISISIRRMHDQAKSGWWILINFVPVIGNIWFIILCCLPSKK